MDRRTFLKYCLIASGAILVPGKKFWQLDQTMMRSNLTLNPIDYMRLLDKHSKDLRKSHMRVYWYHIDQLGKSEPLYSDEVKVAEFQPLEIKPMWGRR